MKFMVNHCKQSLLSPSIAPEVTFTLGPNIFSDMGQKDFILTFTGTTPPQEQIISSNFVKPQKRASLSGLDSECQVKNPTQTLPLKFDWRDQGVVTSVKMQSRCGGCYAFSTIAAFESALLLKQKSSSFLGLFFTPNPDSIDLSEQKVINCAKKYAGLTGSGCSGGQAIWAGKYLEDIGTATEDKVPYTAGFKDPCDDVVGVTNLNLRKTRGLCLRTKYGYGRPVSTRENLSDETIKGLLFEKGPLYALICTTTEFQYYKSGVISISNCPTIINHAVFLVGWDEDSWIVKNHWSENWGEKGYFRVVKGQNMCGINSEFAWPLL